MLLVTLFLIKLFAHINIFELHTTILWHRFMKLYCILSKGFQQIKKLQDDEIALIDIIIIRLQDLIRTNIVLSYHFMWYLRLCRLYFFIFAFMLFIFSEESSLNYIWCHQRAYITVYILHFSWWLKQSKSSLYNDIYTGRKLQWKPIDLFNCSYHCCQRNYCWKTRRYACQSFDLLELVEWQLPLNTNSHVFNCYLSQIIFWY